MSDNKNTDNTTFTWTLTQTDNTDENFHSSDNKDYYNHISINTWTTSSLNAITDLIKDIIDAPIGELTVEQIKNDYSSREWPLSDTKAQQICDYYNIRYTMQQTILNDISSFTLVNDENSISSLTYEFPASAYDYISTVENNNVKYNSATITLNIKGNKHS